MSRYIDADAIHEKYDRYANHSPFGRGHGKTLARFLDLIDEEPTADAVDRNECLKCVFYPFKQLRERREDEQIH